MRKSGDLLYQRIVLGGIAILFFIPYVFSWILAKGRFQLPNEFADLIFRSFLQAALSGLFATSFGLLGAGFLLRHSNRRSSLWENLAIFPAVIPSGIVVLGLLDLVPGWRGLWAISAAHTLLYSGMIAVLLSRLIYDRMGASLELAWIEGASRFLIWRLGVLPRLMPELFRIWLTIVVASLGSFSIPLLLGGTRAYTLEIAIHHAVRLDGSWAIAASLSVFQLLLLVGFLIVFRNVTFRRPLSSAIAVGELAHATKSGESVRRAPVARIIGFGWGFPFLLLGTFVSLYSLVRDPLLGWEQLKSTGLLEHHEALMLALHGSVASSVFSGLLTVTLLLLIATTFPSQAQRRWINAYIAPSVAITGFATLTLGWGATPAFAWDVLRISVGASLIYLPLVWRLRWDEEIGRMEGAVAVARTLGANSTLIISRILFPRLLPSAFWSGGLVAFWMWGDYAVGSVVASRDMTLGLLAKSLMESYRLEAAAVLMGFTLLMGALTYWLFNWGGASVRR